MKKTLFLCAIVSLCGCSVQRSATTSQRIDAQHQERASAQAHAVTTQVVEHKSDAEEVTMTTTDEFDTSQSIDSLTGMPPVMRRTTTQKYTKTIAAATVEQTATSALIRNEATISNSQSHVATTEEVERKFGTHALIWCFLGALAVAAGVVLWWRLKRS